MCMLYLYVFGNIMLHHCTNNAKAQHALHPDCAAQGIRGNEELVEEHLAKGGAGGQTTRAAPHLDSVRTGPVSGQAILHSSAGNGPEGLQDRGLHVDVEEGAFGLLR